MLLRPVNIHGVEILFVMATEKEHGHGLKSIGVDPTIIGIGPVEAAVNTALALSTLMETGNQPELVVSLGSAGSRQLNHGITYQVSEVNYEDMDATPIGAALYQVPFSDIPPIIPMPCFVPGLKKASLSTGAQILTGTEFRWVQGEMVDMETYSVVRACTQFNIPVIGLRCISDGSKIEAKDWESQLALVDESLAKAVQMIFDHLAGKAWFPEMGKLS